MDIEYLLFLQNIRESTGGFINDFFLFITTIAVDYYILVAALVIFWVVDKKSGRRVLLTWGSSLWLNALLKTTFCVYRPWVRDSRIVPAGGAISGATGYSFPSGHSMSSGGFWNSLAICYRKYKGLVVFCVFMVLLTMFSRNFLGYHTPQDVLAGGLGSLLCALAMSRLCDYVENHPDKDWIFLVIATALTAALLYYISAKNYPEDYVDGKLLVDPKTMTVDGWKDPGRFFGILLGWFIERRFINFSTEGSARQKVLRALAGGLITVFWWTAIAGPVGKSIGTGIGYFLTQASTPLVMMTVYPLLFRKPEQASVTEEEENIT